MSPSTLQLCLLRLAAVCKHKPITGSPGSHGELIFITPKRLSLSLALPLSPKPNWQLKDSLVGYKEVSSQLEKSLKEYTWSNTPTTPLARCLHNYSDLNNPLTLWIRHGSRTSNPVHVIEELSLLEQSPHNIPAIEAFLQPNPLPYVPTSLVKLLSADGVEEVLADPQISSMDVPQINPTPPSHKDKPHYH